MSQAEDRPAGSSLWLALVHHPVLNRRREVITTAITNLDVHDIARAARTYDVRGYFIVTPIATQRDLAEKIVGHWVSGHGATRVPERGEALRLVRTAVELDEVRAAVEAEAGQPPVMVATCARAGRATMTYDQVRERLDRGDPILLLLGTGWGLADAVFERCEQVLEPIALPEGSYNHLSVRSAAAVTLDRLLGHHC